MNAFSEYAQNRDFEAASVFRASLLKIPYKKGTAAKRSCFTRDEIKLLLSFPNTKTAIGKRDRTLLCFMYASGARAQEICELTVGDVTFYTDKATVKLLGKGRKVRTISIPSDVAAIMKGYLEYRKIQNKYDRHIFSSQTHEKMTVSCIEEIFFKYVEKGKALSHFLGGSAIHFKNRGRCFICIENRFKVCILPKCINDGLEPVCTFDHPVRK